MIKQKYLLENEKYLKNLNEGLIYLEKFANALNEFGICIKDKPWYKNLLEIYIPKAKLFYNDCKKEDFDIQNKNDYWIRSEFKSFMSEVEKFIKFIIKCTLKNENIRFHSAINELNNLDSKSKIKLKKEIKEEISEIVENLHRWRKNYNENKHDEYKMDDNFYIENNQAVVIGSDILEYVSDFVYRIVCKLLATILIILKNN